jgi:cephalosporin-C deacetylase-like acetyl esterase
MTNHPYWSKAVQYQARQEQTKPQQKTQARDYGGFDSLIVGRACSIELGNGRTIKGVVSAAAKYFYLISIDGQVVIVNKAYVVSITPIQEGGGGSKQNSQGGGVNGNQGSR